MQLTYLWKDEGSGGGGCPAIYDAPNDAGEPGYVVQGIKLSERDRAQLRDVAVDEDAVWVPANVLDRLPART